MSRHLNFARSTRLALSRPGPWVILLPAILGSLLGFVLSFSFPRKYTSEALILVDESESPHGIEQVAPSQNLVQSQLEALLNEEKLKARIDGMALNKSGEQEVADIRRHTRLTRVTLKINDGKRDGKEHSGASQSAKAFHVEYTASTPAEAQLICNAVTSILLQENAGTPPQEAVAPANNLQAVNTAKRDLDERNTNLAQFKKRHVGQLPGDVENNMSAAADLHAQLNMLSEKMQSAQQDKGEAESALHRELSFHPKSEKHNLPQKVENAAVLEKRLSDLQSQLLQLQAQYADDHPDVIKTKKEIVSVEKQLADLKESDQGSQGDTDAAQQENNESLRLKSRIQQDDQEIEKVMMEQKRIQNQISTLEAKLTVQPNVGTEYEQLVRDRDAAQKKYVLAKTSAAADHPSTQNASQSSGRIRMLSPATVPRTPSFPNRLLFAISGWLGLAVMMRLTLWITRTDSPRAINVVANEPEAVSSNT